MKMIAFNRVLCIILFCCIQVSSHALEVKLDQGKIVFKHNNKVVFERDSIWVENHEGVINAYKLEYIDGKLVSKLGMYAIYTETINKQKDYSIGNIELNVLSDEPFVIYNFFKLTKSVSRPYFCIPAVLYGSNNIAGSKGQEPKLNYHGPEGWPASPALYMRSDRSSHPGVITVKDNIVSMIGIEESVDNVEFKVKTEWDALNLYNGMMVDTRPNEFDRIGFSIGYQHYPIRYSNVSFSQKDTPTTKEYRYGYIKGLKGRTLNVKTLYFSGKAQSNADSYKGVKAYYEAFGEAPTRRSSRHEAITKLADALIADVWNDKDKIFGEDDKRLNVGDIGWTGGVQCSYPLLVAGQKTGNKRYGEIATKFINELVNNGFNEVADLFFEAKRDGKWIVSGWWGSFHETQRYSAYLNGQATYYLLKSYELTGGINNKWLDVAKRIVDKAVANQNSMGSYPCHFDAKTGEAFDYINFQSCWFLPATAMMYKITGDKKYYLSSKLAGEYYNSYYLNGEVFGTPMDTWNAVDQEGNLAFVVGCVELHKSTNEKHFLEKAIRGFHWNCSWQLSYNTKHSYSLLRDMNWSSSGGCITSVHNTTTHQMGNLIAGEIYYIYKKTGDKYVYNRLRDMCVWGLGTYNLRDNEFGFGKTGWATEQFFHSDGIMDIQGRTPWDGGIWKSYLPWAATCVLLSCSEDIPDIFFKVK